MVILTFCRCAVQDVKSNIFDFIRVCRAHTSIGEAVCFLLQMNQYTVNSKIERTFCSRIVNDFDMYLKSYKSNSVEIRCFKMVIKWGKNTTLSDHIQDPI